MTLTLIKNTCKLQISACYESKYHHTVLLFFMAEKNVSLYPNTMLQNKWPLIISSSIPPVSTERAGYGLRWLRWFRAAPPEIPADGGVAAMCPTKGALCNINIGPQLLHLET